MKWRDTKWVNLCEPEKSWDAVISVSSCQDQESICISINIPLEYGTQIAVWCWWWLIETGKIPTGFVLVSFFFVLYDYVG